MPYRKPQQNSSTYLSPVKIPMPNEKEASYGYFGGKKNPHGIQSIFEFIKKRISIEELILIGLIILLLDESMEDDFLLLILIYILLF